MEVNNEAMNPFNIPDFQHLLPRILEYLDNKSICQLRETWNKVIWVDKFPRDEIFEIFHSLTFPACF